MWNSSINTSKQNTGSYQNPSPLWRWPDPRRDAGMVQRTQTYRQNSHDHRVRCRKCLWQKSSVFIIKFNRESKTEGNIPQHKKVVWQVYSQHYTKRRQIHSNSTKIRNHRRLFTISTPFQCSTQNTQAGAIRQETVIKEIRRRKRRIQIIFIYVRDTKNSTIKFLEIIIILSKVAGHKNILAEINNLSIYNKQTCWDRTHDTVSFSMASKTIRYLGINITNEVKDL